MAESDETELAAGAAWINGTVMPIAEARLPINDWGITWCATDPRNA